LLKSSPIIDVEIMTDDRRFNFSRWWS
jgi:hypothetical protein